VSSSHNERTVPQTAHTHAPANVGRLGWAAILAGAIGVAWLIGHHLTTASPGAEGPHAYAVPAMWACAPFVAMLLSIAIFPLVPAVAGWWDSNRNRLCVALGLGAVTLLYYLLHGGLSRAVGTLEQAIVVEYLPFIILLFSLYVISGGISVQGDLPAHPATNTAFLGIGSLLASLIGTTGASMLLIRPLLHANSERRRVVHTVIFFIFLVSNIGGSLLPTGDPPLFVGYLRGVPFLWTLRLFPEWLVTCGLLLVVYYIWDSLAWRHEERKNIAADESQRTPLRVRGCVNLLWLLGVVLCVGLVNPEAELPGLGFRPFPFLRELVMLLLVALSLRTTPAGAREANRFNYHAILEVAALFVGIFLCMQVPIEILTEKGDKLGLTRPVDYFWATGALSSFLDNAPTYAVFFSAAEAVSRSATEGVLNLIGGGHILENLLAGVSLGAVFMGSMTYIGNGPNFMVRSIAEQSGVRMPSFFGYMVYSIAILIPTFLLMTYLFIR